MSKLRALVAEVVHDERVQEMGRLARWSLTSIVVLFVLSRIVVWAIMSHVLPPWLFLNVGGTHIHHYVYGVFLLLGLATWVLFYPPKTNRLRRFAAVWYGVASALLLDELAMWLTMKSNYYGKASVDAIIVLLSLLTATSLLPQFKKIDTWPERIALWVLALAAGLVVVYVSNDLYSQLRPWFNQLSAQSPP